MPTIKTIKPAGGGDYTNLQAWWNAVKTAATADQWAECYGGNLGTLDTTGYTFTPDSGHYPRIYAADQHIGVLDLAKPHVATTGTSIGILVRTGLNYFELDGLTLYKNGTGVDSLLYFENVENIHVHHNLIIESVANNGISFRLASVTPQTTRIYNNILSKVTTSLVGTENLHLLNGQNHNAVQLYNNTFYNGNFPNVSFRNASLWVADSRNNIYLSGAASNFSEEIGGSSVDATLSSSSHDLITGSSFIWSTATACLTSQAIGSVVNNVLSDWDLPNTSPALEAGVTVVAIADDVRRIGRPQGTSYDIGSFEHVVVTTGETYPQAVLRLTPKAYYRQNDSAAVMSDSTPNSYHGTHNSSVVHFQSALIRNSTDAASLYVPASQSTIPNIIDDPSMSFEFWFVWAIGTPPQSKIFSFNGSYGVFEPRSDVSGRARFSYGGKFVDSLLPLQLNQIYYIVCNINNGQLQFYLNAVLQGTATGAYKLFRVHSIAGPFNGSTVFTTDSTLDVTNFSWIAAASEEEAIKQVIAGTATVHSLPRFPVHSYTYPTSNAFRYYDRDTLTFDSNFGYHTIPAHSIGLEDIYGFSESDSDYNDVYWTVDIETAGETLGNNLLGINLNGRLDEFAIYDRPLAFPEILYHWLLGHGADSPGSLLESFGFVETLGLQKISNRAATDSITFSDLSGKIRKLTESLNFSEQLARQRLGKSSGSDTLAVVDIYKLELLSGNIKTIHSADIVFFNDHAEGFTTKTARDVLTFTESVATPGLAYQSLFSLIEFRETLVFQIPGKIFRAVSDVISFNEIASFTTNIHAFTLKDTVSFTDSLGLRAPFRITNRDTLVFSDEVKKNLQKVTVLESFSFLDMIHKNLNVSKINEEFGFKESLRVSPLKPKVTDTLGPFNEVATVITNHQLLKESFSFDEIAIGHMSIVNSSLSDMLAFNENAFVHYGVANVSITETLQFNESLKRIVEEILTDTITFTEHWARFLTLSDSLAFTETLVALKVKALQDTLQFLEALCVCFVPVRHLSDMITFTESVRWLKNNRNNPPPVPVGDFRIHGIYKIKLVEYIAFRENIRMPTIYQGCCMGLGDRMSFSESGLLDVTTSGSHSVIPFP
jgi:hypothetical protein